MNTHKAIILAAGRGRRMGRLTDKQPKCMTRLHKQSLFDRLLKVLYGGGCDRIAVVSGYLNHYFDAYDIKKFVNHRWHETNMVTSLLAANSWLEQYTCIVSYSDIYYSLATVRALCHSNALLTISYDPNWEALWRGRFEDPLSDAETFSLNSEQNVLEIGRKTKNIEEIQGQYMGLLKITPDAWLNIKDLLSHYESSEIDTMDMTFLLNQLVQNDIQVHAIPCQGPWGEIDSESDLQYFRSR